MYDELSAEDIFAPQKYYKYYKINPKEIKIQINYGDVDFYLKFLIYLSLPN